MAEVSDPPGQLGLLHPGEEGGPGAVVGAGDQQVQVGSAGGDLPPPVYCPGLSGPLGAALARLMERLPGRSCQRTRAATAQSDRLYS